MYKVLINGFKTATVVKVGTFEDRPAVFLLCGAILSKLTDGTWRFQRDENHVDGVTVETLDTFGECR